MVRILTLLAPAMLLAQTATANTIRVDQLPAGEIKSGDVHVLYRDVTQPAQVTMSLLHVMAGADWQAAGADGIGDDLGGHGDIPLSRVVEWLTDHDQPTNELIINATITTPVPLPGTTAVIKRLSVRLGSELYRLGDTLVVPSTQDKPGQLRLRIDPDYMLESRASDHGESFRISAEIQAPPGTAVSFSIAADPRDIIESVGAGQLGGVSGSGVFTPSFGGGSARGGGGGGGATQTRRMYMPATAPLIGSPAAPIRLRQDITNVEIAEAIGDIGEEPAPSPQREDPIDDAEDLVTPDDPEPVPPTPPDPIPPTPPDPDPPTPDPPDPPRPIPPNPPPVPEPASGLLLLAGGAILLKRRRRV